MIAFEYSSGSTRYDLYPDYSLGGTGKVHLLGATMYQAGTETYKGYWSAQHMPREVVRSLLAHCTKLEKIIAQRKEDEARLLEMLRR